MFTVLVLLHVLIAFCLVLVILMQSNKGAGGLAGAFGGGGGNQTVFGGRGAVDFLGKATWVLGSAFMINSLLLAMLAGARSDGGSLIEKSVLPPAATAPADPGAGGSPVGVDPLANEPTEAAPPNTGTSPQESPSSGEEPAAGGEQVPATGGN